MKNIVVDADIKQEYGNQAKFLNSSVDTLRKRLEKESQIHKEDSLKTMNDNIMLIVMIGQLRDQVKDVDIKCNLAKARNAAFGRDLSKDGVNVPDLTLLSLGHGGDDEQQQFEYMANAMTEKKNAMVMMNENIQAMMQEAQRVE